MATKSRKKRTTRNTTTVRKKKAERDAFSLEIMAIVMFAASIFLFLCNMEMVGTFGTAVKKILFGLFGVTAYIIPFLVFFGVIIYIINKENRLVKRKIIASIFLIYCVAMVFELFTFELSNITTDTVKNLYNLSAEGYKGGGLLAGLLTYALNLYLDKVGTMLVIIVIMIICLVLITEKSFISGVKKGSEKVYESAVKEAEYMRQRKEENKQRVRVEETEEVEPKEEHEAPVVPVKRMEKKVSGVMENTKLTPPEKEKDLLSGDNIHEIILDENIDKPEDNYNIPEPKGIMNDNYDEVVPIRTVKKPEETVTRRTGIQQNQQSIKSPQTQEVVPTVSQPRRTNRKYNLPPTSLLTKTDTSARGDSPQQLKETAMKLQKTLEIFGVKATITDISKGPAVTRYELQPEIGTKVSKIVSLADDIKLNLAATDIRIEAPIPGKAAVGIEIPNKENTAVGLRELLESTEFQTKDSNIAFAVGKDLAGQTIVADIAKMLHVLIAGATGSGKSVCINTLIMSILYKASPDEVKFIMIDPKVVELSVFNGIPHLLLPVVTEPKKAAGALHWGVEEMTRRYKLFADYNVKDLAHYNSKVETIKAAPDQPELQKLPQIVIIVDELADLMMVAQQAVEESICRLAQLARAAGIHLIIATQRPSVDVITGLIKANMPSRIAFSVTSGVDSRTILDMNGAEKLLGKGDMLFFPQGYNKPSRIQGAFVSDKDVVNVVDFIKAQGIIVEQNDEINNKVHNYSESGNGQISFEGESNEYDALFVEAGKCIIDKEKASIGMLQRAFKIGFNRAARIMEQLADAGVVSEEDSTKPRKVIMSMEQFEQFIEENL